MTTATLDPYPHHESSPHISRGSFILIEGLDRAGKTTQVKKLCDRLYASGRNVKLMRFPGIYNLIIIPDYCSPDQGEELEAHNSRQNNINRPADKFLPSIIYYSPRPINPPSLFCESLGECPRNSRFYRTRLHNRLRSLLLFWNDLYILQVPERIPKPPFSRMVQKSRNRTTNAR